MARALDLAVTPWSVLGAGVLTGKYSRGERPDEGRAREGAATVERNLEIADAVCDVADEIGCTPGQVALSWVRQQPGVVIPLLGARNLPQLEDNLGCLNVELSADQLARLEEVSRVEPGFPHDFLADDYIRDIMSGGTHDLLDNHRPGRVG
jgi:aryl-alcohol dehydrogenase-like predicted oxidoreductase